MQPVAQRGVVHAGLAAGDHVAVAEALDLPGGHRPRRHRAGVDHVGHAAHPAHQLAMREDRHDGGDIAGMDIADRAIVVGEHIPGMDAGIGLPIVLDHVLDRGPHRTDVDDDPGGSQHAVARGVVEREAQLPFLLDDRAGGDLLGRFTGVHQAAAQLGEKLLVADRVPFAECQARKPVVVAGVGGALQDGVAELLERLAGLEQVGEPDFLAGHHIHGVSPYFTSLRWKR